MAEVPDGWLDEVQMMLDRRTCDMQSREKPMRDYLELFRSVELPSPGPYEADPEGLVFDESRCQMGDLCCWEKPPPIGGYLRMDPETTVDIPSWATPWRLPDGRMVCEDCADAYDEGVRNLVETAEGMAEHLEGLGDENATKMLGAVIAIGETAPFDIQFRRSDGDPDPVLWTVAVGYGVTPENPPVWVATSSADLADAVLLMCNRVIDGGICPYCQRITSMTVDDADDADDAVLGLMICRFEWDPELPAFTRGCLTHGMPDEALVAFLADEETKT